MTRNYSVKFNDQKRASAPKAKADAAAISLEDPNSLISVQQTLDADQEASLFPSPLAVEVTLSLDQKRGKAPVQYPLSDRLGWYHLAEIFAPYMSPPGTFAPIDALGSTISPSTSFVI